MVYSNIHDTTKTSKNNITFTLYDKEIEVYETDNPTYKNFQEIIKKIKELGIYINKKKQERFYRKLNKKIIFLRSTTNIPIIKKKKMFSDNIGVRNFRRRG